MTQAAKPVGHPAIELLGRYRAVLRAAWAMRRDLAGPRWLADEAAFLPAALSLQATPVHPAPRRAMWVIMALFAASLIWAIVGQVDIVAVANGRIVVSERTKLIQPLEPAVVRAIHVRDGDPVRAGQVLIELDPTGASADRASVQEQLRAAESEAQRSQALLAALSSGQDSAAIPRLTGATREVQALLAAEWQDIQARRAKLAAELTRREAELATARELLTKLQTTLPLVRQREVDFQGLAEQGFIAGHAGQDRTRERIEQERDLATQQARVAEGQAVLAESRQARAAYLAETQRALSDRAAQARVKAAQLRQEGAKTEQRERLTRLTSPVAGTVQQLAVHSTGGVVTSAQALMVIVPEGAEVTAEVAVDNKDIGFVRAGQVAEIKLETFSFTRYGTVPAQVIGVAADAVADEKRGAIFPATLRMKQGRIDIDGKSVALNPGMNVTAEIKTGRRRVIEFLLSPLQRTVSESGRER